jgi:hypothetical protein
VEDDALIEPLAIQLHTRIEAAPFEGPLSFVPAA